MSGKIDKFGRKRQRTNDLPIIFTDGELNVCNRQFVNVRELQENDNLITLDYFKKHRFDFENTRARLVGDTEEISDAANKHYVDKALLRHKSNMEVSLQTMVTNTVKHEIRRMMSKATERSADDEFEDE